MNPPRDLPPAIPSHWTPDQALAAFEMLDALRDELWHRYGPQIQRALRAEQQREDHRQLSFPLDLEPPF